MTAAAPRARTSVWHLEPAIAAAGWIAFIALTWGPVLGVLSEALAELASGTGDAWALLLISPRRAGLFGRSLLLSLGVTGIASLVGTLAALGFLKLAAGRHLSGALRSALIAALAVWAIAPAYLHALGAMEAGYVLRGLFGAGLAELEGWAAVLLIEAVALMPFPILGALIGFLGVERDRIETGMLQKPDGLVFRRIALPLARPALSAGAGAVFVLSLLDANTPSLFGVPSYAMEITAEYSASHAPWRAALLSLPLIAVAVLALALVLLSVRTTPSAHGRGFRATLCNHRPLDPFPVLTRAALAATLAYALLAILLLLGGLSLWQSLPGLLWSVRTDLSVTLANAVLAGLIALVPAAIVATSLAARRGGPVTRGALWALALLPLALPPSLTGLGIAGFMSDVAPGGMRSLAVLPAVAHAARFMPLAMLIVWAQYRRLDPLLLDAARLQHPPGLKRYARIDLPLLAPGMIAAFALVFCGSVGELEAAMMTAAPGAGMLSMRVFNYLHYGASETVAALGLLLVTIVWLAVLIGLHFMRNDTVKGGGA